MPASQSFGINSVFTIGLPPCGFKLEEVMSMENIKQYVPAATGMLACAWVAAYAGFTLGTGFRAEAGADIAKSAATPNIVERAQAGPHSD